MHLLLVGFIALTLSGLLSYSAPTSAATSADQNITALSKAQVAAYRPYTFFAGTGYCPPNSTLTWSCGANCLANPDFKPVASGGDGESVQYWFVGYSPSLNRVIVSHEGTQLDAIVSMLTDVSILQTTLNSVLFPGIGSDISVHCGFAEAHARSAISVLAAVKMALDKYKANHVTMVGHSLGSFHFTDIVLGALLDILGGALTLLDSVYLPLHLPPSVKFNTVTYGLPRVGNLAFANYVDAHVSLTRINNQEDIVPIIPSRFPLLPLLEYHHAAGEVHIQASGEWDSCPGQENESELCSAGDVNILTGSIANHDGPYDGVDFDLVCA
ncbi:lipase [Mycena capillaripes]|nr:lipase [Mycena capillaripes]